MKKRILCGILILFMAGLIGCEQKKEALEPDEKKQQTTEDKRVGEDKRINTEDEQIEGTKELQESNEPDIKSVTINVYYPNPDSGDIISKSVEIEKIDAQLIWEALTAAEVVSDASEVLGIENDGEIIILDVNKGFGNQLRSVGTTQEKEILNSVVYTYLDAFRCEKMKIMEDGGVLSTSHKDYDNYFEKK